MSFLNILFIRLNYMSNKTKTKIKVKSDMFPDFISKLADLTDISDTIKLKIDNDNVMMYSTLGGAVLLAFKNYLIDTNDYFIIDELEYSIDVVILNAKKFVKNLNFLKESDNVVINLTHKSSQDDDNVMVARTIQITGGKLKINWVAGEHYEIRDITKDILNDRLNLRHRKWNFTIYKQDFNDIKKLSSINGDKLLNINVNNGKVVISETGAWELDIFDTMDDRNSTMILNKRFLKCIDDSKDIDFSIFENFMLIKDNTTNLMLSYEQSFDESEYE